MDDIFPQMGFLPMIGREHSDQENKKWQKARLLPHMDMLVSTKEMWIYGEPIIITVVARIYRYCRKYLYVMVSGMQEICHFF